MAARSAWVLRGPALRVVVLEDRARFVGGGHSGRVSSPVPQCERGVGAADGNLQLAGHVLLVGQLGEQPSPLAVAIAADVVQSDLQKSRGLGM